ncbi:hypothetical protein [Achromobacter pestifer]|uniref:Lipoprotein n=1 Tax=Achromobacter pestifer TaxID=1353889 RepID=A0A6S7A6N9_9BURK|nr:hypothetical protein [Achromobacter pestifer]CAB3657089.1 hypothetical protein LMG3431_03163 [Achromobacter pestifer]
MFIISPPRASRRALVLLGAAALTALSGCSSLLSEGTGAAAGIAGTAIANKVTDNATVATGIGLGVQAGAKAALAYAQRKTRGEEQDAIATAAGPLDVGAVAHWSVKHQLPIESDAQGQVAVSRLIGGVGLQCKEVVFSIDTPAEKAGGDPQREFFVTTVCRDGAQWRWASAEPATARWGSLQ